jgi:predicted MFS family arabinose efflux permease
VSLLSPYRAVLRTPHACGAFAISLVGRLCYGTVSLSLILTLTAGGRDYGLAGLVLALFGLTVVLVSPFRTWTVDRHGPRRVLPPMAAGFAATLVAIAAIPARSGASDVAIAVLAAAAGACAPPLGVVMRTLWSALIDDRDVLQTAYSLDGVAEELLYVAGPMIVGLIVVVATPAIGLLVSAGLVVAGTGLFLRSPALRRWSAPVARPTASTPEAATGKAGTGRAILALAFATGAIGLCLGGLGLVIVAFSQARRDPAAVAWIEAALSAGSALGGLGYGAVTWRISAQHRLVLLATGLAVILIPAALSPDLFVLALLIGLAGVLVSPALATAYVLADRLASPKARNHAGNWVNSGYNAGVSAGAALSGQLVGRIPLSACLPVLAAPALLAVVPLLPQGRWMESPSRMASVPQLASKCNASAERDPGSAS